MENEKITWSETASANFIIHNPIIHNPIGHWVIGKGKYGKFNLPSYKKPNWFHKKMMKLLLDIGWEDYK